jgi:hypothetical protein
VCALLIPKGVPVTLCLALAAHLRAEAIVRKPEWQALTDIEILEEVLRTLRDHPIAETINKKSTTTQVGSLIEEK